MDRDQRSRRQKSNSGSFAARPHRSVSSRVGLQKADAPRQTRGQASGRQPQSRPRPAQTKQASGQGAAPRPPRQTNPQKPGYRPGAPKRQRRVTQAELLRRRRRRTLFGVLAVLAVLAVGAFLSVNLLFKVTAFRVEDFDRNTLADTGTYSAEEIVAALNLEQGTNLFGFSTKEKADELSQKLPYLDRVQVDIQLPGTVVVKVQPATERFAVPYADGWAVLSDRLKILRTAQERPQGLLSITMTLPDDFDPQVGQYVEPASYNSLLDADLQATAETALLQASAPDVLAELLEQLEAQSLLEGTTAVDIADLSQISITYQDRVLVELGNSNNMEYKLRLAAVALLDPDKGLSAGDRGTLDVSNQLSDGEIRGYFQPYEQPTPTPEPTPEPDP